MGFSHELLSRAREISPQSLTTGSTLSTEGSRKENLDPFGLKKRAIASIISIPFLCTV